MQRCLAAGITPGEFWDLSFEETLLVVQANSDRVNVQWHQTRLLIFTIAATVTDPEKRGEVYDLFYLPGDPTPEEREAEAKRVYDEMMTAQRDFTDELRREISGTKKK
jgi:hypothetical protein